MDVCMVCVWMCAWCVCVWMCAWCVCVYTGIKAICYPPGRLESFPSQLQVHDLKVELRTMKAGLHNTSRFIQEPKELKEAIKTLYRKHLNDYDQVQLIGGGTVYDYKT